MTETLTTQMHDYFAYLDGEQGAVDLVTVREPRLGDGPVRTIQLTTPSPRRTRRGWIVAGAVSAAVLVLVGGLAFLLSPTGPDTPVSDSVVPAPVPPTTSYQQQQRPQWPGLTEDIPEGVESGTLTTSLGTARWVRLSGDEFALPGLGPLEVSAYEPHYGAFIVSDIPTGFWYSDGGIEWTREERPWDDEGEAGIPDDTDQMTYFFTDSDGDGHILPMVPYADGSSGLYWIISSDPMRISNWEGGPTGGSYDLSGLVPPDSDGFTWDTDISRPISRYGNPEGTPEEIQAVLHVTFTGPDQQVDQRLLVLSDGYDVGSATYLDVPWDVSSDVTLFGTSHSVYAYVHDWTTGQISVWRTGDGYAWTNLGPMHDQLNATSSSDFQLTVLPAQERAFSRPMRNQVVVVTTPGRGWESSDGVNWTLAPDGFPGGTDLIRLESGWFATDGDAWWMHLGDSWVSLAELGIDRIGDGCQLVPRASEQTTVFFSTGPCTADSSQQSTTDLWIISVDS